MAQNKQLKENELNIAGEPTPPPPPAPDFKNKSKEGVRQATELPVRQLDEDLKQANKRELARQARENN
jgi:hypothetical protein